MFRLTGLYIVGAWLIIQVADIAFPAWGIPDTALRYLFYAAFLCFPIAFILGWFFDIRKDGIYRTRKAGADETVETRLQRTDYAILAALLAVGLAILLGSADLIQEETESYPAISKTIERPDNSIAVLPFVNLDANPDTGYFSDGVTEEILTRLSTLGALHVLGRTSSFAFRNTEEGPARISEILGVRYLLHGSVRRDNEHVRVSARLIDESGYQVWGQSFDRKLESIFVIQSEIASSVTSQIVKEIVPLSEQPEGRTTTNMLAYDQYLLGKALWVARTPGWITTAETAFRKAIELDPGFAPPYAGLAFAIGWFEESREEAWQVVNRAIELDPLLADAYVSRGFLHLRDDDEETRKSSLQRAEESFRQALALDPTLALAYNLLGNTLHYQGLAAEGNAVREQGLELNPLDRALTVNVAHTNKRRGNFERAEQLMLRLTQLPEPPRFVYRHLRILYYDLGQLDKVIQWHQEGVRTLLGHMREESEVDPSIRHELMGAFEAYAMLGMADDSRYWLETGLQFERDAVTRYLQDVYALSLVGEWAEVRSLLDAFEQRTDTAYGDLPAGLAGRFGGLHVLAGNYLLGIKLLEPAIDVESLKGNYTRNAMIEMETVFALALAYRQVGRKDDARTLLLELQAILEPLASSGELVIANTFANLALSRAMLDDQDGALRALERAVELGWIDYYGIIDRPEWADTIDTLAFQQLLAEVKQEIDRQRAIVEAADAEHDFRAEIEQLLEGLPTE
jgi:TolB-like protein/tetratricopeptide (TPR) repeat protein